MATVMIAQCLQRDFTDPIGSHDPLPNLLQIGCSQAVRRGRRVGLKEIGDDTDKSDLRAGNRTIHAANIRKYSALGVPARE
jgi:hypothetical protein